MSKKKFTFGEITERAREQMRDDDQAVKASIAKWPELENLIPALTNEEYSQLSANIRAEGCRDPLVLWQTDGQAVLVDGHNRFRVCTEHQEELVTKFGYDYRYIFREFADVEAAKDWMINNQLGKRNLTEEWKSYLRGIQYRAEKQQQGRPKKGADGQPTDGLKTAERLAELHKVSDKTIRRDEKFVEVLEKITGDNDQLRKDILNRTVRLPKMELLSLENEDERILRRVGELVRKNARPQGRTAQDHRQGRGKARGQTAGQGQGTARRAGQPLGRLAPTFWIARLCLLLPPCSTANPAELCCPFSSCCPKKTARCASATRGCFRGRSKNCPPPTVGT